MRILAEYVWIGGNLELRSKTKVFPDNFSYNSVDDLPEWNFDGSSTGQAEGHDSEVIIKPRVIFPDPFRKNNNIIVLCDTYLPNGQPHTTNNRSKAKELFDKKLDEVPWFGLEQEYFMIDTKTKKPLGLNNDFLKQGQYYCSIGAENAFGRNLVEEHLEACLYAGLKISGINAEVAPGQWEFQVGPCEGIEAGDHMWIARYLLGRLSEKYDVRIEYHPKPILENINGSGCHCNFSTVSMREGTQEKTGLEIIDEALVKLSLKHMEHMEVYGEGNQKRMTGLHETAKYDEFSFGRANRGRSVRIGNETINSKKGYFEDRRPASNCDPYLVTSKIFETTCL
jgi:glutamine synthetase